MIQTAPEVLASENHGHGPALVDNLPTGPPYELNSKFAEPRRIATNSSKTNMLTQENIGRGFLFLNATN